MAGLFQARSLLRREFAAYFLSPIAYVVLVVFLAVTGHLFYLTMQQLTAAGPKGVEFPMQMMLGDGCRFWLVFLFIPPLLTMAFFAEERSTARWKCLGDGPTARLAGGPEQVHRLYRVLRRPVAADAGLSAGPRTCRRRSSGPAGRRVQPRVRRRAGASCCLAWLPGGTGMRLVVLALLLGGAIAAGVGGWLHYHERRGVGADRGPASTPGR